MSASWKARACWPLRYQSHASAPGKAFQGACNYAKFRQPKEKSLASTLHVNPVSEPIGARDGSWANKPAVKPYMVIPCLNLVTSRDSSWAGKPCRQ